MGCEEEHRLNWWNGWGWIFGGTRTPAGRGFFEGEHGLNGWNGWGRIFGGTCLAADGRGLDYLG